MLSREEYVEQAHFFETLAGRMQQQLATQELMISLKEELLATTKLPHALDFMAGELRHHGVFAPAMRKLAHYFTPFQTYVMQEAESDRGRFDLNTGLEILHREAKYRADGCTPQGIFLYQFEALCRNRLGYDRGLEAIAADPIFDDDWRQWIGTVRRQIGLVDICDLLYVRSAHYADRQTDFAADFDDEDPDGEASDDRPPAEASRPILFGEKEGKIALANRRKDPLLLFAALQRHLGYPAVPHPQPPDETFDRLPQMIRRLERLEVRLKLLEEEGKGGIDLSQFMPKPRSGDDG